MKVMRFARRFLILLGILAICTIGLPVMAGNPDAPHVCPVKSAADNAGGNLTLQNIIDAARTPEVRSFTRNSVGTLLIDNGTAVMFGTQSSVRLQNKGTTYVVTYDKEPVWCTTADNRTVDCSNTEMLLTGATFASFDQKLKEMLGATRAGTPGGSQPSGS